MGTMVSRRAVLAGALATAFGALPLVGCVRLQGEEASTEEYEFDDVTAIDLDLSACEAIVRKGDGFVVTVERVNYPEVIVETVDGVLRVSEGEDDAKLLDASVCKVDVTVPGDCELDSLDIVVAAGRILVSDVTAHKMELDVEAGDVTLEGATTDDATITADAGAITVTDFADVQEANVSLEVEVGEVTFLGEPQGASFQQTGSGPSLTAKMEVGSIEVA